MRWQSRPYEEKYELFNATCQGVGIVYLAQFSVASVRRLYRQPHAFHYPLFAVVLSAALAKKLSTDMFRSGKWKGKAVKKALVKSAISVHLKQLQTNAYHKKRS